MAEEPSGSLETETSTHTGGNRHVPMRGWLHKIGRRATAECELCRRSKENSEGGAPGVVPTESIGHIQSAGCAGQSEAVTAAHNKCIRDLMGDIQVHRKKKSNLTFLTMEEEHTISTLWEQDGCSKICSKEELWQAAKSDEMQIQLRGGDDASGASEQQYEERFWRRKLDGGLMQRGRKDSHISAEMCTRK